jgi:phosphoribosylamine--glycine ligase
MRVVIVGSGGREHAIAWKVGQSALVSEVVCLPGNPGTAREANTRNLACDIKDVATTVDCIAELGVDLVVVGPEAPLVSGLADALRERGIDVVGPGKKAAALEGSKAFAKQLMRSAGIPTGQAITCRDEASAHAAIDQFPGVPVIKADGLAAGKGVTVCETKEEARVAATSALQGAFGDAGSSILVEERLEGTEASYIVLTDGHTFVPLTSSQDHKRLLDGDRGPNTGGMGAFAPTPTVSAEVERQIQTRIIAPTLAIAREQRLDLRGFLYAGLMLTEDGPKVLEFNVRLGDPEAQAILYGLEDDLVPLLQQAARGRLVEVTLTSKPAATVVVASEGYPGRPLKGRPIQGLDRVPEDVKVFVAGATRRDGQLVSSGGRVLAVSARGDSLSAALERAYRGVEGIELEGMHYRRDIGRTVR